jgi:hypothetical protein
MHIPNRAGDIALGIDVRGTTRLREASSENNRDCYTSPDYENWPDIVSGGFCIAAGSRRADGRPYVFKVGKGTDLRTMQDYLGHRDPAMTVRYTRVAARRFEGLF